MYYYCSNIELLGCLSSSSCLVHSCCFVDDFVVLEFVQLGDSSHQHCWPILGILCCWFVASMVAFVHYSVCLEHDLVDNIVDRAPYQMIDWRLQHFVARLLALETELKL